MVHGFIICRGSKEEVTYGRLICVLFMIVFLNREAIVRERKHHEQVYADQKRLGELLHLRQQTLEAPKPPAAH